MMPKWAKLAVLGKATGAVIVAGKLAMRGSAVGAANVPMVQSVLAGLVKSMRLAMSCAPPEPATACVPVLVVCQIGNLCRKSLVKFQMP